MRRGANVILHGDTYHEASLHAHELARKKKLTYVHPYDDPLVIAGQGTIGMEILRQHPKPIHAIFVAVGAGHLSGSDSVISMLEKSGYKVKRVQ